MELAAAYLGNTADQVKDLLAGGTLAVYSVARPGSPDLPVQRSGLLATFTFGTPAFSGDTPVFAEAVTGVDTGTPGFARATTADGATVADFSVGPAGGEIRLAEVSVTKDYPVTIRDFSLKESVVS